MTSEKKDTLSVENHMQVFARLVQAGKDGIHNPPQKKTKKQH